MKNKKILIILFVLLIILCILLFLKPKIASYIEQKRIENATVIVELKDDLAIPFNEEVRISDFITNINGNIIDDKMIDTTTVGTKEVSFEYVNEEDIKVPYKYKIKVVDNEPPLIWLGNTYTISTTFEESLEKKIMCADNVDDKPDCHIIGNYDPKTPGNYKLVYEAIDSSGNKASQPFTLIVKKPSNNSNKNNNSSNEIKGQNFKDIVAKYKNENTKIGIDVSRWQGDIDYQKVKEAGVEFAFIKVGGTLGIDGEYYTDKKFKQNIEGFNNVGIPVGIYIYTYAKSPKNAKDDALWVMNEIKDYKVDLPIVYDWENWSIYNEFELSFFNLTKNAKVFFETVEDKGYTGALYSSKNYLEKVRLETDREVWLAHYTQQTSYQGKFKYWQLCENGLIDGINGFVDIDVMYN